MDSNNSIKFSFMQISDLRLGSTSSLSLHLSPSQRQQRLEESLEALQNAISLAKEKSLDAILVPGNLFDSQNVTAKTISALQKTFASLDSIPVYITPGFLDPLGRDSFYLSDVLNSRGLDNWPANVHIFRGPGLQTTSLPEKANIRISGVAIHNQNPDRDQTTPVLEEHDRCALNVMLLPIRAEYKDKSLSDEELTEIIGQANFSYTAVSGPLNQCRVRSEGGRVIAAASGTFTAQSASETGARVAFVASLSRRLPERLELELEPIELDPRRIINLKLDLSSLEPSNWKTELESNLTACGARQDDILLFDLSGTYPAGVEQDLVQQIRDKSFFHIRCSDVSRPDYLSTLSAENKIEQSLIDHMNRLFAESPDDEQLSVIDDALYLGLEALREGKITLRNAD